MGKAQLDKITVQKIINLRKSGHSLNEITQQVKCSRTTVYRYIQDVSVGGKYLELLKRKQGRSAYRSELMWNEERERAERFLSEINEREIFFLLVGLYWGEGTKRELNLINGDPRLMRVFLRGLYSLGVRSEDIRMNLRVFGAHNMNKTKSFWLSQLKLTPDNLVGFEILPNNGGVRLPHGMCRIRVVKSQRFFKRIMSMIHLLGNETP